MKKFKLSDVVYTTVFLPKKETEFFVAKVKLLKFPSKGKKGCLVEIMEIGTNPIMLKEEVTEQKKLLRRKISKEFHELSFSLPDFMNPNDWFTREDT